MFDRGFPALAGMDPPLISRRPAPHGLPRARGDGPVQAGTRDVEAAASPRSRGWTRPARPRTAADVGFPALAGMDPARRLWAPCAAGLPRARGDGPEVGRGEIHRRPASPRSRGWTLAPSCAPRAPPGFPALAGMDLYHYHRRARLRGLPRARGDGPAARKPRSSVWRASPRSRGWTFSSRADPRPQAGFPALAGMDPGRELDGRTWDGLPRARGDGPTHLAATGPELSASPRSRGWTPRRRRRRCARRGFPALAGMDLVQVRARSPAARLPRARGDGPAAKSASSRAGEASPRSRGWTPDNLGNPLEFPGFPALAGMDPWSTFARPPGLRLPRARGDGPGGGGRGMSDEEASPRSRGWTSDRCLAAPAVCGFPALAGMDPASGCPTSPGSGLPRARGDGPGPIPARPRLLRASPRSRGWTRSRDRS